MTDERIRIIFSGATNLIVTAFIGSAWLIGKVSSTEALIPLLALSGLEIAGRARKRGDSLVPPPGPTAALLFLTLQAAWPSVTAAMA